MSQRTPLNAATGLSRTDRLPAPPPRPASGQEPPAETPSRDAGESPAPTKPSGGVPQSGGGARGPRRASDSAKTYAKTSISMPADLAAAWRERAREEGSTQVEVLLDAIHASHERLGDLLEQAQAGTTSDGLFVRRAPREAAAVTLVSMKMLSANLSAIDDLVRQHQAPSRSALCAAALRAYLEDDTDQD